MAVIPKQDVITMTYRAGSGGDRELEGRLLKKLADGWRVTDQKLATHTSREERVQDRDMRGQPYDKPVKVADTISWVTQSFILEKDEG